MCDLNYYYNEINSIPTSYTKPILFLSAGGVIALRYRPYTWTQEDYDKLKEAIKRVKEIRDEALQNYDAN
jgi:hypothetical protein